MITNRNLSNLSMAGTIAVASCFPGLGLAGNSFTIVISAGGQTTTDTTSSLDEFTDLGLSTTGYSSLNPSYSDMAPANVSLDFRGLPMSVVYPDTSASLVYSVPELGFTRTFDARATREGNEDDLLDFLQQDEEGLLSRILNYFVSETGTDPVAGNPASLQGTMISSDFGVGTGLGGGGSFSPSEPGAGGEEGRQNVYGLGARLGQYQVDGNDITTIDLPFTLVRPLSDPRYALIFDLPLTYSEYDGSQSVAASLGVGMRVPITTRWTLTPMLRVGATGSTDLGSLSALYSGSLSSSYKFDLGATEVNIGNMLSYIATSSLSGAVDDYEIDYDLQNTVSRNGIGFAGPLGYDLFGQDTTWEASAVNTQIFGDDVYINNYTDLAVSIGTQSSRNGLTWDSLRIGFTYTVGNNGFQGGRLNFGYQF